MSKLKLIQLPVPPPAAYASTGNVPLASSSLASAVFLSGPFPGLETESVVPEITDTMGDRELAEYLAKEEPEFAGFSLYLWNSERSIYIAEELKKKSPETKILFGGPEVNEDNLFLLENSSADVLVSGEAEHIISEVLRKLRHFESPSVNGTAFRKHRNEGFKFTQELNPDFPLNRYPSPYLSGFLNVDPFRSTYLETVRGCKSSCSYCFYPRSSGGELRTLDIDESINLIRNLKEKGAAELVFLDPTFNHRPGFEKFLDRLSDLNSDGQMKFFAELRSEGLNRNIAEKLARAGFYRIELGMQSVNRETLKRVQRYGNPEKVAESAVILKSLGIDLLLDLIIGLPGDSPSDVLNGIDFFKKYELEEFVQAFFLSVLPGTKLRTDAVQEGLVYSPYPPYRVIRTESFSEKELLETFFAAEDGLDRRLDEYPRPNLVSCSPDCNDAFSADLDLEIPQDFFRPAARHSTVYFSSASLYEKKDRMISLIRRKIELDPFCTMDFVLCTDVEFPVDLIDVIKGVLNQASPNYLKRVLAHRGEDLQHRISVLVSENHSCREGWFSEIMKSVPVFENMNSEKAVRFRKKLGYSLPGARIFNETVSESDWKKLSDADPEAVCFAHRPLERRWTNEVLNYSETG
ncbi:MAG TPA: radical SAM protein [Leptospiraceae bacterium]|nr:radical SAM protein [Leptospiraceae bacterium]